MRGKNVIQNNEILTQFYVCQFKRGDATHLTVTRRRETSRAMQYEYLTAGTQAARAEEIH